MNAPAGIPPEELAWARECALAGDTIDDIAEGSGRSPDEWRRELDGAGVRCVKPLDELAPRDAVIAERYLDGVTFSEIGREIGVCGWWARQLAERLVRAGYLVRRPPAISSLTDRDRVAIITAYRERARQGLCQYLPERNAAILDLVSQNVSYTAASAAHGITRQAVAGIVHRDRKRRGVR